MERFRKRPRGRLRVGRRRSKTEQRWIALDRSRGGSVLTAIGQVPSFQKIPPLKMEDIDRDLPFGAAGDSHDLPVDGIAQVLFRPICARIEKSRRWLQ